MYHAYFIDESNSFYCGGELTTVPYTTSGSFSPWKHAFLMAYKVTDTCLGSSYTPSLGTPQNMGAIDTFSAGFTFS